MIEKSKTDIAIQELRQTSNDSNFIHFLNTLNEVERKAWLYIEAQRANTFLNELTQIFGNDFSIDDIRKPENRNKVKHILHSDSQIDNLIQFWDDFGNQSDVSFETKISLIDKHNQYYRILNNQEVDFILNC